jgi:hypothetical protein
MSRFAVFFFAMTLVAFVPRSAAREQMIWGVNGHPLVSYPGLTYEQQLDLVRDLGMTSYRVDVPSTDKVSGLKTLIDLAKPRGIDILPVLAPNLDLDKETVEDLYEKAHAFAVYYVSRFKDDIDVWELGNELENYAIIKACEMRDNGVQYNCDWGPAGGVAPLDYFGPRWAKVSAVLKGMSDGVISVDPTIRKAMGTAGWGHIGAFERMRQDGIRWDISVWHMYGEDPAWAFEKLAKYGKPIWVTEFNHPLGSKQGVVKQAIGLKNSMTRLLELRGKFNIQAAHIYELLDETYWAPDFEAFMGLIYLDKDQHGNWSASGQKPAYCVAQKITFGDYRSVPDSSESGSKGKLPKEDQSKAPKRECDLCLFDPRDAAPESKVRYSYCLILGRGADGDGLKSWTAELKKGLPVGNLLIGMIQSDEFDQRYRSSGLGNSDYVAFMRRLLFRRKPDSQSSADDVAALDKGDLSRSDLVRRLIKGDEFRRQHPVLFQQNERRKAGAPTAAIDRQCDLASLANRDASLSNKIAYSYCLVLGRKVDGGGLESWTAALKKGGTIDDVLLGGLASEEFKQKHKTSELSNSDYINLIYRLLFDRDADGRGYAEYLAALEKGDLSRSGLAKAIIHSAEFRSRHPVLFRPTDAKVAPSQ